VVSTRAAGDHAAGDRATSVLVILDGASEPLRDAPTSLERARTPALDGLAAQGAVTALRTVPPGLPAGSETAIPGLLGWVPDAALDRGAIEAAAHGIEVGQWERAWRVDRRDRANAAATTAVLERLLAERLPRGRDGRGHRVHHLAGHRMLVVGPDSTPTLGAELLGIELRSGLLGVELVVWPAGETPPRVLGEDTVVIGARGAAIGIARLMGARTIVPAGATGRPGSDIAAKAAAALAAMDAGAARVVVHVGTADEAAHELDAEAKVTAIETADALLLGPLADALRARGGTLRVCPDHGCDPTTGEHDDMPVPCLDWPAPASAPPSALGAGSRLTERTIAEEPTTVAVVAA
jgi:2,3-bisphosphoglycerate-independent phosphoglycerate mutase